MTTEEKAAIVNNLRFQVLEAYKHKRELMFVEAEQIGALVGLEPLDVDEADNTANLDEHAIMAVARREATLSETEIIEE